MLFAYDAQVLLLSKPMVEWVSEAPIAKKKEKEGQWVGREREEREKTLGTQTIPSSLPPPSPPA